MVDVVSVIGTIGGCFVEPIKKHCGYLFHYNSNIKNLEDRIGNLRAMRDGVKLKIDAALNDGQEIFPLVVRWVEKVENILDEDAEANKKGLILDEDAEANKKGLDGWCPRYSLSRKAKKKTLEIDVLLNAGQFNEVALPPTPQGIGSSFIEGIMDFESRIKMRREVLEALRADKVNMIAICGMGGIGKTTLAKEVAKRAKDDKLFDEVVMVVVSQNQELTRNQVLRRVQVQIAEMLGLKLVEESELVRAERLNKRLSMDSKRVLVILDDVWDALDLLEVGIPYGGEHNRCKILLTSRSEEACTQMKTQKIFPIKVLFEDEAWNLFRRMVGNCIDTPNLHPIAKKVAEECGGLPVAIVTVGRALENKCEFEWSAALQQLQNAIPKNIPDLDSKVYSSIELSYSYLKSDEAKSCFLLCCLFPEDSHILIELLVRYGVGQRLFAKIDTVAEARNRVHAIVKNLKRSYLLLDSELGEEFVKMHDVVRDVAISIAENRGFLVRCNENMEEWPEKVSCERSTAISLESRKLERHPDGLECPKLELLQLGFNRGTLRMLPPNLFKGMKGLMVLSLYGLSCPSLPQSINVLENLRTLQFNRCVIRDVSAIGELKKLEILSFKNSRIEELPGEMRNLSHLKLLELIRCIGLGRIPPDLLSSLSHLEEFYLEESYMLGEDVMFGGVYDEVEDEYLIEKGEEEKKGPNTSLTRRSSLSSSVDLKIKTPKDLLSCLSHLEESYMLGEDMMFEGVYDEVEDEYLIEKEEEEGGVCDEVEEAYVIEKEEEEKKGPNTSLTELSSLSYLVDLKIKTPNIEVFPKDLRFKNEMIKFKIIAGCDKELTTDYSNYLFKNSLELGRCDVSDIAESRMFLQLLKKSEILKLERIKDLKNIVHELDNEGFQYLKVLQVCFSVDVEYVMNATLDRNPHAAFPTLESLVLLGLPNLKEIYHSQFPRKSFSGIHSQLACFGKLTSIDLDNCGCLKNVFSLSIARGLVQLQEFCLRSCNDMEECFPKEGEDEKELDKITFRQLKSIDMRRLPKLIGFCTGVDPVELVQPSLNREVGGIGTDEVTNLEKHKMTDNQQRTGPFPESTPIISHRLFSSNTILWPPNLENLFLMEALSLEVIFDLEGLNINNNCQRIIVLAQLKTLIVRYLCKLTYVWKNVPLGIQGFQKLTSVVVCGCHRLRYLFPTSIAKLLVELQSIEIEECGAIENIVQRDGEEGATVIILFPRVSSLKLQKLPNIKACSFEWSSVKEICLRDCPKLKINGSEIQSPRKSMEISRELDSRPNEQELKSPSFRWRCLECVPRRKNYGLMAVSDQGTTNKSQKSYSVKEEGTLSKPKDLKVSDSDNPPKIWSFFPSHIIKCLKNLESIELINVLSPEVIFQLEELNVEESHTALVLDQLRKMDLSDLPKLMHIWKKGPERILGFGNLRFLEVSRCNSLTYLFSPSIAKLLVMLEEIEVEHCEKIEEILARAGEEEQEKDVLFNKVNSIMLHNLPNLKCFCSETNALDWPSLKEIRVIGCPSLRTFIPSNLNTPKLGGVYNELPSEWKEGTSHWKGELNATIEHIFKGKEKLANHETQQEDKIETIEKDM